MPVIDHAIGVTLDLLSGRLPLAAGDLNPLPLYADTHSAPGSGRTYPISASLGALPHRGEPDRKTFFALLATISGLYHRCDGNIARG